MKQMMGSRIRRERALVLAALSRGARTENPANAGYRERRRAVLSVTCSSVRYMQISRRDLIQGGDTLRETRLAKGLTIAELSAISGISPATIMRFEHDAHVPQKSTRLLLTQALEQVEREVAMT